MLLESSFRPRFSKYPKPKRGIGPGSLKIGAKEGYRPRSSRTRSQKVAGSQGYRPRSKETWCQKGVNGFGSSNNRSHKVYLGFKIREPFFLPVPAPLQFHSLSLFAAPTATTPFGHRRPPLASATTMRASALHFASLSRALSLSLSVAPTATTPSGHHRRVSAAAAPITTTPERARARA